MQHPLAQHSTLSYPLHHRSNTTTLFSQTGSVTVCETLQPGSGLQAAPEILLHLYYIPYDPHGGNRGSTLLLCDKDLNLGLLVWTAST